MKNKRLFNFFRAHISNGTIDNLSDKDQAYIHDYICKNRILYHVLPDINFDEHLPQFLDKKKLLKFYDLYYLSYMNDVSILNKVFRKNSIKPIFLKGAFFNLRGIKNRYCSDIDILIKKEQLPLVKDILSYSDFFIRNNDHNYDFSETSHQTDTLKTINGFSIDLHYRLTHPVRIRKDECALTNRIYENTKEIVFAGEKYLSPSIEDSYLHVAYHALEHDRCSVGPIYFYDLANFKALKMNSDHFNSLKSIKQANFRNLITLSLNIADKLGINYGYKQKSISDKNLENAISLILEGYKIRNLNKNYDRRALKDSFKGINMRSFNSKTKNFALYLFTILVNFRKWRMIKKIDKFLNKGI